MVENSAPPEMSRRVTDYRPICAILFVLVIMGWQLLSEALPTKNIFIHNVMSLQVKHDNILYLEEGSSRDSASTIPPPFSPLFFAPVPINLADQQLLQTIPGIGSGLAGRIVDWRRTHGPLRDVDDLLTIPGIGKKRAASWAEYFSFVTSQ